MKDYSVEQNKTTGRFDYVLTFEDANPISFESSNAFLTSNWRAGHKIIIGGFYNEQVGNYLVILNLDQKEKIEAVITLTSL